MSSANQSKTNSHLQLKDIVFAKPTLPKDPDSMSNISTVFKKELSDWKIQQELYARVALECGKRCLMVKPKLSSEDQQLLQEMRADQQYDKRNYPLSYGEQLCTSRCVSKFKNVKEVADGKLKDQIEMPPILFNQNLP